MTEHVIVNPLFSVWLVFGQWVHAHPTVWQVLLTLLWAFCMRATAASTDELERLIGIAVLDALQHAHLTVKEACAIMGCDVAHFQQALRCERHRHLSLNHLIKLPVRFWLWLLPEISYLVVRQNVQDIAEEFRRRNA